MSEVETEKRWDMYVLRYCHTHNYYVGTTPDLENRMKIHFRRTSHRRGVPWWSIDNKSTHGFLCYWFDISTNESRAAHCERALAKCLREQIDLYSYQFNCKPLVGFDSSNPEKPGWRGNHDTVPQIHDYLISVNQLRLDIPPFEQAVSCSEVHIIEAMTPVLVSNDIARCIFRRS